MTKDYDHWDEDKQTQKDYDKDDHDSLKRVSSYAKEHDMSVQWVYKLASRGDIKLIEIDGMKFIKTTSLNLKNLR